jgi:flotillin
VEVELKKIGLHMINCNIRDISDDSGYIEALGKEAAAKAINDAQIRVAQENQRGASGKALAERDQTIAVAESKAAAATGSNKAEQNIVSSMAELAAKKAEADGRVEAAQKTAKAQAEKAGFEAQRLSEDARALRDEASSKADQVAKANATKERVRVDAEAEAVRARTIAEGQAAAVRSIAAGEADAVKLRATAEAAAIAMKLKAEAEGKKAILDAQAEGLKGFTNTADAIQLILAQQLVQVATVQAGAIANLKMDKVVLMGGGDHGVSPGSFVQDLYRQVLPMHEIAQQAGVKLPAFLGTAVSAPTKSSRVNPAVGDGDGVDGASTPPRS